MKLNAMGLFSRLSLPDRSKNNSSVAAVNLHITIDLILLVISIIYSLLANYLLETRKSLRGIALF